MFLLTTTTGVPFTYTCDIPDRSKMQMVDFHIDSPYTKRASVLTMNVASLALSGKTVEQVLIHHVEHYQAAAAREETDAE